MLKANELNKKVTGSNKKNELTIKNSTTMNTQVLNGWTGTNTNTMTTKNGNKKAFFRMATHETNANGEKVTVWHNMAAWNKVAELVQGLASGTPIQVEGYNHTHTAANGKQFTEFVIVKIF